MESPNVNRDAVLKSLLLNETNSDGQPRKRRRLDNLTVEERALRRKLKNRVAAQTARDRKKARMVDLEEAVESLERENKRLRDNNHKLLKHTDTLSSENSELRVRLGLTPPVSPVSSLSSLPPSPIPSPQTMDSVEENRVVIKKEIESKESAAEELDSVSFSDHDLDSDELQSELFVGVYEDDESSDEEFLQPKQELKQSCRHGNKAGSQLTIKPFGDQEVESFAQGLDHLVGQASEQLESLDEILNCKDMSMEMELQRLDVEPGTLGDSGMNDVWEESFTDLFPALLAV